MPSLYKNRTPLDLWKSHVESWSGCELCPLYLNRTQVVIARGQVPCDILFVGYAPGRSEDVLGKPFVGPAGKLQDSITSEALYGMPWRVAYTNLVCCLPLDKDNEIRDPDRHEIGACSERLAETVAVFQPKLLVAVGSLVRTWLPRYSGGHEVIAVDHPSFILRSVASTRGHLIQRAIVVLRTAAEAIGTAKPKPSAVMTDDIPF